MIMVIISSIILFFGINSLILFYYLGDLTEPPNIKYLNVPISYLFIFYFLSWILVLFPKWLTNKREYDHYKYEYNYLRKHNKTYIESGLDIRYQCVARKLKILKLNKKIKRKKLWGKLTLMKYIQ